MSIEQSAATGPGQGALARGELWLLAGFIVVTLNLRIAFAGLGPILGELRLSTTQATLIASLPPICLSLFALVGVRLRQRFGEERTLFAALSVLAVGCGMRALGVSGLFAGTLLAGVGIAVMNVVVPALVRKRFQPTRIGHIMGLFSLMLGGGAVLTAGLTVPIYRGLGGNVDAAYLTLGAWAIPALIALVFWAPQLIHGQPVAATAPTLSAVRPRVLKNRTAWSITLFFGLQALNLYGLLVWLPGIYIERGATVGQAALYLAVSQAGLVLGGYFAPVLAARVKDQRGYIAATVGCCLAGCLGGDAHTGSRPGRGTGPECLAVCAAQPRPTGHHSVVGHGPGLWFHDCSARPAGHGPAASVLRRLGPAGASLDRHPGVRALCFVACRQTRHPGRLNTKEQAYPMKCP